MRHRGLVSQKHMPEMLRTLVSLEGVEARGLGDVAPQAERPLTVDHLEKLVVFLTPRRLGERPKEGAGLARNSAMPLTIFVFLLTSSAARSFGPCMTSFTASPCLSFTVGSMRDDSAAASSARAKALRAASLAFPPATADASVVSRMIRKASTAAAASAACREALVGFPAGSDASGQAAEI